MDKVTCVDKDKLTYEVEASNLIWRPCVYAIIIRENKILLVPEWDGYYLPGGGIELGETLEEGLKREVKEETGLDIEVGLLIDCKSSFFKRASKEGEFLHSILLYYTARVTGGHLTTDGFDEEEKVYARLAEWIDISEIENINFKSSFDIKPIIHKSLHS